MEGVEIVNVIHNYASLINPIWLLNILMIMLVVGLIGALTVKFDIIQDICVTLFLFLSVILCLGIIGTGIETNEIIDTTYKITVSDEVSLMELSEKYEIIEQDGKIFTVRER